MSLPETGECCVPVTRGLVAMVDPEDFARVSQYSWRALGKGNTWYAGHAFSSAPKTYHYELLHRFILNAPPGVEVDHINGDGLDNRRANLRLATTSQNQANRRKGLGGLSRFKGVRWNKVRAKWYAEIVVNRRKAYLGLFIIEEDAARAYDRGAISAFGEYARLNFPTDAADQSLSPAGTSASTMA